MELRGVRVNELNRLARYQDGKEVPKGLVSRLVNDERDTPNPALIEACARVLRVRAAWILFNEEPMTSSESGEMPATHAGIVLKPNLERAIAGVRGARWSRATLAIARSAEMPDLEIGEWIHRLDAIEAGLRSAGLESLLDQLTSGRFSRPPAAPAGDERPRKKPPNRDSED